MPTWSAPVRYAEVDQQGIVFNSHYLLYCDEAMSAFCAGRGLAGFATDVRLAASTVQWLAPLRWGDTIEVDARCLRVGRTSLTLEFAVSTAGRTCFTAQTTYVHTDADGVPQPVSDDERARLTAPA